MRTNMGELIAKPFGMISGAYALNRTGEVCHRASQAIGVVLLIIWFIIFRPAFLQLDAILFFTSALVVVSALSMVALRNGRKLG